MITVLNTAHDLRHWRNTIDCEVALVPTMGNLHQGHLNLAKQALIETPVVIVSIFVNPTQFAPGEDLAKYPRTWEADLSKLNNLLRDYPDRKMAIYFPSGENELYPHPNSTTVRVDAFDGYLEGELRPTHMQGVATVVSKLFLQAKPTRAYFGKKDYQQWRLCQRLSLDLFLDVEVIGIEIERCPRGLALSSRNQYLSEEQYQKALTLPQAIEHTASLIRDGELAKAQNFVRQKQTEDSNFNYLSIRRQSDLQTPGPEDRLLVILGNYQLGETRLLDNKEVTIREF